MPHGLKPSGRRILAPFRYVLNTANDLRIS